MESNRIHNYSRQWPAVQITSAQTVSRLKQILSYIHANNSVYNLSFQASKSESLLTNKFFLVFIDGAKCSGLNNVMEYLANMCLILLA